MDRRKDDAGNENGRLNRLDLFFLALIVLGLGLGAGYIVLEWGWEHAIAYGGIVCLGAGVIGGMRR